eukprot:768349-Hanusia_phi.AAC.3
MMLTHEVLQELQQSLWTPCPPPLDWVAALQVVSGGEADNGDPSHVLEGLEDSETFLYKEGQCSASTRRFQSVSAVNEPAWDRHSVKRLVVRSLTTLAIE